LRLAPETIVTFANLSLGSKGEKITRVGVQMGTIYVNVKDRDKQDLTVAFNQEQLRIKHSSRFRATVNKEGLEVAVFRGDVDFEGADEQHVTVKKNETLAVDYSEPERYYLSRGISESPHDYWDREREEQVVAAETRRSAPQSDLVYGYDDLSSYGSWVQTPEGQLWRPYGVTYDWSPYDSGAWLWYPTYGYTWVSGYPWGWTPFHFGGWHFFNNIGWCWRPGPRIFMGNFNFFNPPAGFVPPRPPVVHRGHPFAIVAKLNGDQSDPHSDWLPQPRTPRDVGSVRGLRGEDSRVITGRAATSSMTSAGATAAPARVLGGQVTPDRASDMSPMTRTRVDHSGRVHTADRDYNAVDYRRTRSADDQVNPGVPVVNRGSSMMTSPATTGGIQTREQINRMPTNRREAIDRDMPTIRSVPAPGTAQTAPTHSAPPSQAAPMPRPTIDRSPSGSVAPRVDARPAPMPAPAVQSPAARPTPSAPAGGPRVRDR
jgi:hypothetical protein